MAETLGANFSIDVSQLRKGLKEANQLIRESQSEFKAAAAGMEDWTQSEEGLNAKNKQLTETAELQRKKVEALNADYQRLIKEGLDPTSNEASKLRTQISNEEAALAKTETELTKNTAAMDALKKSTAEEAYEAETASKKQKELQSKIEALNNTADTQRNTISDLKANYVDLINDGMEPTSKEAKKLKEQIDKEEESLAKTESQIDQYNERLEDNRSVMRRVQGDIDGWRSKLNQLKEDHKIAYKAIENVGDIAKASAKVAVASVAAIGAAAVGAGKEIWSMANEVSAAGDEIDKESQKLGLSAESYQKLNYAMELNGSSISDLSKGVKKITSELADAENGVSGAGESFEQLGVKLQNSDGSMKNTEQVLLESIDALSKMENETQRNALAQDIFGKSAAELNPLLNAGADGIKSLMQEAEDYGMVMSDDAVSASAAFQDSLERMKGTFTGLKNSLISSFLPSITGVMDGLSDLISGKDGAEEKITNGVLGIIDTIRNIIPKAKDFLMPILKALLKELPVIFDSLLSLIIELLPEISEAVFDAVPQLVDTLIKATPQILKAIAIVFEQAFNALVGLLPEIVKVGKAMLSGLFDGFLDPKKIWEACKKMFNSIMESLKTLFGIHSPSKVMENVIGKNLALGIGEGFEDAIGKVNTEITDAMRFGNPSFNVSGAYSGSGNGGKTVVVNQYNTYSQAHSRYEIYKSKQQTAAAVRLAMAGA